MKRTKFLLPLLLTVLLFLTACAPEHTADTESKTISDGKNTYTYQDNAREQDGTFRRAITITYPNQSWYYHYDTRHADGTEESSSTVINDRGQILYTSGKELVAAIDPSLIVEQKKESYFTFGQKRDYEFNPGLFFMGLFFAVYGLLMWRKPYDFWWWNHGWAYKNAEPSDRSIGRYMASGMILTVLGIILAIISFFG